VRGLLIHHALYAQTLYTLTTAERLLRYQVNIELHTVRKSLPSSRHIS
jgi:hypothetical protein